MIGEDNFDDLFVNEDDVFDKKLTKEILQRYVQFTKREEILTNESFNELKNKSKMLIIILSKKVLAYRKGEQERVKPKEIEELTGIPHGSIGHMLPELERSRLLRSEDGKYWIPNYAISLIKKFLGIE